MDSQEEMLLAEIVENPDDDMPRLIYADWLEERGDPRAEFIRVQCELVNPGSQVPMSELQRTERRLIAAHRAEWLDQLGMPLMWYDFRRGFVEDAVVRAAAFIWQQGRLLEVSPIRHLRIHLTDIEQAAAFARIASLRHLRRLHLSANQASRALLAPLLASDHLRDLQQLFLLDARLEHSEIQSLRRKIAQAR
jgi:uncharacterized protein (TIGR02996 family)